MFSFPESLSFLIRSSLKKKKFTLFTAKWIDLEHITLSEVSQRKKISYDITYMSNLKKNDTNELIYETNKLTDLENKFMVIKGEGGGWGAGKLGVWD